MKLEKLTLCGFQCFSGDQATTIEFDKTITMLLGPNGSGKTAVMSALARMFGAGGRGRGLRRTDFYRKDTKSELEARELVVEAFFKFPNLTNDDGDDLAVPPIFEHLCCDDQKELWLRVRLEGSLSFDNDVQGEIEENIYAVTTMDSAVEPKHLVILRAAVRNTIRVHYIPARRDPLKELVSSATSMLGRLLRAGLWTNDAAKDIQKQALDFAKQASVQIGHHGAVGLINKALEEAWQTLHRGQYLTKPAIQFLPNQMHELLAQAAVVFSPAPESERADLSLLSDGQKSLFYLSMLIVTSALERVAASPEMASHFDITKLRPAAYVLFALEEPENHLSPHYIGRIMRQLKGFAEKADAQAVISTHSASTVGRTHPNALRHLRLDRERRAVVRRLTLPHNEKESEAYQFIVESVRTYPELFFARVVILGEGESERIVLPRLFAAAGSASTDSGVGGLLNLDLRAGRVVDDSFISVVPIGGRHVNHFWRLLYDLEIPFVTLLDLDRGRKDGGWGRVKYAAEQLMLWSKQSETAIYFAENGTKIREWNDPGDVCAGDGKAWLEFLQTQRVFFSQPLDLDFAMLEQFAKYYQVLRDGKRGPNAQPDDPDEGTEFRASLLKAVLKSANQGSGHYTSTHLDLFRWYRYLFIQGSKPVNHVEALGSLDDDVITAKIPTVYRHLLDEVARLVRTAPE